EGKLYFHQDNQRVLGNFKREKSQSPVLAWLDLESGSITPVVSPGRRPVEVFCLSQNAAQLAFVSTQDVDGEQGGHNGPEADIWTVSANGGDLRKLVRFRSRVFD